MRTEGCREWRDSLGAYALGQLADEERVGLDAHLEGCPDCRAELSELESVARIMPLAEPERFAAPPQPPPGLRKRIEATIAGERRASRKKKRRFGFALGGAAAAAAAAALAIFVLGGGSSPGPERHISFAALPPGMKIGATLEPRAYGTEVHMYVGGVPSGTLCRVVLRGPHGVRLPAGTFRYRDGQSDAVLSSALDLSQTRTIVVHVGRRAFVASVSARL